MSEPLNQAELKLIARLLEMAGDEFSNHGCNDFMLENTQENRYLMLEYFRDEGEPAELNVYPEGIYANDAGLMEYMAKRVKAQVTP